MWRVLEHRRVDRQLLVRYEKWKDVVSLSGPPGLRLIKGFHDEALSGQWAGHRSSRLGVQWRVIYLAEASEVRILVMAVTAHDYRRAR
jgi:mRNA-degrading endonuclease YafQ of YafQ-DinJ toxin-antitoxin module